MLPLMFDRIPPLQTLRAFEAAFHWRASGWRLHRLKARHSDLDIHLDVTDVNIDPNEGRVAATVRYGSGRYRHALAEQILEESVTPVCGTAWKAAAAHGRIAIPVPVHHDLTDNPGSNAGPATNERT